MDPGPNQMDPGPNQMDPGPKSNGPGSKIKSDSDHCGEPPETVAGGSHLRQCLRKKLWRVISGSPHTPIVSFDSPQRVPSAAQSSVDIAIHLL